MKQQLKLFAVTMAVALPANAHSGTDINPTVTNLNCTKIAEARQLKAYVAEVKNKKDKRPSVGRPVKQSRANTST